MQHLPPALQPQDAILLVIDVQERLVPAIHDKDACVAGVRLMVEAAKIFAMPILATEQYPAGLGPTCSAIRDHWGAVQPVAKMRFSSCVEGLVDQLRQLDRPHVIVTGIEAHVCVQQSVLDLLRLGYTPYVCVDAVSARKVVDRDVAFERMRDAGAIITTTESVIFELAGEAGTDTFKKLLRLVK